MLKHVVILAGAYLLAGCNGGEASTVAAGSTTEGSTSEPTSDGGAETETVLTPPARCVEDDAGEMHCYVFKNGFAVVGGDIIVGYAEDFDTGTPSSAWYKDLKRWNGGVIPYVIADGFTPDGLKEINDAFAEYVQKTSVRWVPRSNQADYVIFTPKEDVACYSPLGRRGGPQTIQLVPWGGDCTVHEIGHALGIAHEHQRPDRGDHIAIHYSQVKDDFKDAFSVENYASTLLPYDITSVMHYSSFTFAKSSEPTITRLDDGLIDRQSHLSEGDVEGINYYYPPPPQSSRWGLLGVGGDEFLQWRTDNNEDLARHYAQARRWLNNGQLQGQQWVDLNNAGDLYAEGDNSAPWGLVSLGSQGLVQWRTDGGGQALIARAWLSDNDKLVLSASWTTLNPGNDLYAEGDNQGPWGLVSLGSQGFAQWRTDDGGQLLIARVWLVDNGKLVQSGSWATLNPDNGLYAEGNNQGPWGLVSLGAQGIVQWRTDGGGQALVVRVWPLDNGGFVQSGDWTMLNPDNDLYAEGDNQAPWGLVSLGSQGIVQWRTDGGGQLLIARPWHLSGSVLTLAGAWAQLNSPDDQYADDNNAGPWGLIGLGADQLIHWRTDRTLQELILRKCALPQGVCEQWQHETEFYPE